MRVDDRPVVLLYGALPMYRDVGPAPLVAAVGTGTGTAVGTGTTPASVPPMVGNDVAELESNLKALGYTGFTVDTTFGGGTKAAVKKWQHEIGVPETGQVLRGDVAVLPGPVRIGPPLVQLGAPASAEALTYTGLDLVVSATASTGDPSWTTAGASATILGADGRRVDGVLTVPATTSAATGASSSASILVVPKDPRALDGLEPGRALVERVSAQHDNVLAVPVEALVALAEGLRTPTGRRRGSTLRRRPDRPVFQRDGRGVRAAGHRGPARQSPAMTGSPPSSRSAPSSRGMPVA